MESQPRSLYIIFLAEFIDKFAYWGLQSLLVLYLTHDLNLSSHKAYAVFGMFTAFTFALSSIGGLLADKVFGFKRAFSIGILFIIAGNLALVSHKLDFIYAGLALIVCGAALFTSSNSNLLGAFYRHADPRRDRGFTILYMGTNFGG